MERVAAGDFSPTLFFGGMVGVSVAGLAGMAWPLAQADVLTLAVVGMSATLGAVVRAPLTGILIVFEMTHEFGLVPALMLTALISQTISRRMLSHNFYDALLKQDGVQLEHVQPPRDWRDWHEMPVAAFANFKPVVLCELTPPVLEEALARTTYDRFPVVRDGVLAGMLTRAEARLALRERRPPKLLPAITVSPTASIREAQPQLLEAETGMVVLLDESQGRVLGLLTLHDLLRAQSTLAKHDESEI